MQSCLLYNLHCLTFLKAKRLLKSLFNERHWIGFRTNFIKTIYLYSHKDEMEKKVFLPHCDAIVGKDNQH
jgi:hypothetical protein